MYEGLTIRVIGYTLYPGSNYEIAIGGSDKRSFALWKWNGNYAYAFLKPTSGDLLYSLGTKPYYYGDHYSFAIRAQSDGVRGAAYQTINYETVWNAVAFSWYGAFHWEIIGPGTNMHLSKHIYVTSPATLPMESGLDSILKFVRMEIGTVAHYSGTYKGPSEIRVIAPGAVKDLARPVNSEITIIFRTQSEGDTIICRISQPQAADDDSVGGDALKPLKEISL
ncbi:uncharacterized protein LOC142772319 [Rhipicephalus microplus]|uniref:uncharacterized protein LOC142772319 n=1 Tax=Rhipicephalus microplus TaxID=6941 RepID=UPI003F6CE00B